MGSEMVGMNEMDAIRSFGDAVEWAIRSESASELGALSPARSFASLVDSAIRSSDGSVTDSIPSSPSRSTHDAQWRKELFLPLPVPVPVLQWDTKLATPLPLPPSGRKNGRGSQQAQQVILFSDLERLNRIESRNGSVYKVVHKRSGQVYALTVIYGHQEEWIRIRQQVHREIQIARNEDHPNVVKCHEICDENNDEIQVLVEFMGRGSMEGKHISHELQLADLSRQILRGLAYLHRRHIVHSDIKPSNILINSRNQVKIADFVVGRILNQITMDPCNSSVGKIAYMSPERINMEISDGQYDAYAGDIWSFGVTILELYMGKFPFGVPRDGDWASLMCAISLCQPPQPPSHASFHFTHFIDKCLQRDPSRRWSASRLLQHPFITQKDHGSHSPK